MRQISFIKLGRLTALITLALFLQACGSSSSTNGDPLAESSIASRGIVTGFGSVYVNGVRYLSDSAQIIVDDNPAQESDLRVGMVVTVAAQRMGGEVIADSIIYDNELKGPVSNITMVDATKVTLTILGQLVEVNANTTIDDDGGLRFETIALNDVLEVNGYRTDTVLIATHIELQAGDDEIEIKGHIDMLTSNGPGSNSLEINGFPVSYDDTTELDGIDILADGMFVEVEGQLNAAGDTLIAVKIEAEQEGLSGDSEEAEVEGVIYGFVDVTKTFKIMGQTVDASNADFYPASLMLMKGLTVEAEGRIRIIDGVRVLVADEVEQKGRKIKINAVLSAVDTTNMLNQVIFKFNGKDIPVRVNRATEIEDKINDVEISLSALSAGDFVELEAFDDNSGVINAVEIERRLADETVISASVDSFSSDTGITGTVELLGVDFVLNSSVSFQNEDEAVISLTDFFDALVIGEFIKIKDTDDDGVFDKAELAD